MVYSCKGLHTIIIIYEGSLMPRGRPTHARIVLEGYETVWRKAKNVEELLPLLIGKALHAEAHRIKRYSQTFVPVDTGRLKNAAYVTKPTFNGPIVETSVGYDLEQAPYAIRVHEMPRAGQTSGIGPAERFQKYRSWATTGQWKYLETPANAMLPTSKARIAADVQANLALMSWLRRG